MYLQSLFSKTIFKISVYICSLELILLIGLSISVTQKSL